MIISKTKKKKLSKLPGKVRMLDDNYRCMRFTFFLQ